MNRKLWAALATGAAVLMGTLTLVPDTAVGDQPVTTRVMVRAIAKDAKVIGDGVGGAVIHIRDVETGQVLAEGVQRGGTGNTQAIMTDARPRGLTAYGVDPQAAGFLAELSLSAPTLVDISAEGPGTPAHAVGRASKTILLIPGHDIVGEGIILELNGFRVELLEPSAVRFAGRERLDVRAKITMMCGCPTQPDGLWDSNDFTLVARLLKDGSVVEKDHLAFSGETSVFQASLPLDAPGNYVLEVIAVDAGKGNTGMARAELTVTD
ncbi:MAG: hypothetical protein EP301_00670 [Gammaproteobacteria bacterium]|nr:MAG: hypothetical protein EP301_00670 [Gammaproteobacteria bacterium]